MIKTIKTMSKQEKERYTVPRKVQDVIPVRRIWPDGIFLTGNRFSKTYRFSDINYLVASREDKESMFLTYSELLNSLDSGAVTKITINNRRLNKANFETSILMPISNEQMSYVTNADAGCGLIRYGSALVPFINRFPRDTRLYALMTTKPGEGVFGGEEVPA